MGVKVTDIYRVGENTPERRGIPPDSDEKDAHGRAGATRRGKSSLPVTERQGRAQPHDLNNAISKRATEL